MNDFLRYIIESGISLAVLYTTYLLFLRKQTCFGLIRLYLLASIVFSLVIPLVQINTTATISFLPVFALNEIRVTPGSQIPPLSDLPALRDLLFYLYVAVSAFFLFRFLVSLTRIFILVLRNEVQDYRGYHMVFLEQDLPPFSFFNFIFMHHSCRQYGIKEIVEHEKAHIRLWHSLDILLSELLVVLQWCNPFAWLYRRTLNENHEFIADEAVLKLGYSIESYQERIISQVFGINTIPLTNNFNKSITNKRIDMMEKNKSSRISRLGFLPAIPIAVALTLAFACGTKEPGQLSDKLKSEESLQDTGAASLVYINPDEPAVFPGGMDALRKFIAENVKYPEEARKKGIEGKLYIQFVVDETGRVIPVKGEKGAEIPPPPPPPPPPSSKDKSLTDEVNDTGSGKVIKAVEAEGIVVVGFKPPEGTSKNYSKEDIALLEQEAIRVIKSIPAFEKPAMYEGKPVKSLFTIPINFALQ